MSRKGDRAEALTWLSRALELGHPIVEIETAPALAALRADPRGRRLLAGASVPAAQPSTTTEKGGMK